MSDDSATRTTLTHPGSSALGPSGRRSGAPHRGFTRCPPGVFRDAFSSGARCLPFTVTRHASQVSEAWLHAVAASPWLYPVLYLLVVGDAFLVVLPSETFVVALGVLSAATGQPPLWAVIPVAALGAITGDLLCFRIGRSVGLERWRWQRSPRVARAIERARAGVHRRPAALILTARYIPFARIAVNLAAGATALPTRVFLPLAAVAGTAWAVYNSLIGAAVGHLVPNPVIAVVISVAIALVVGATVDAVGGRLSRLSSRRAEP